MKTATTNRIPAPSSSTVRGIAQLATGELDSRSQQALYLKLLNGAYDQSRRHVYKGRLPGNEEATAWDEGLRAHIRAAHHKGEDARTARYASELTALNAASRAAAPRPGTYEHELAMMRG